MLVGRKGGTDTMQSLQWAMSTLLWNFNTTALSPSCSVLLDVVLLTLLFIIYQEYGHSFYFQQVNATIYSTVAKNS